MRPPVLRGSALRTMASYRLLEHTADMGIAAFAESREALYVAAAEGLMAIIDPAGSIRSLQERKLTVEADDAGELMVSWLGEVLYLVEQGFLPCTFGIARISETALEAIVAGEPFDSRRHALAREVKAITFHRLRVERTAGGWRARIFVDL